MKYEKDTELYHKIKDEDEPELDKVFYGNNAMASLPKFVYNLKEKGDKIPFDEAKVYYENQPVKQIFKPFEKPVNYNHITALYPFEKVYLDSMYLKLDKSTLAFINVIDLFSKFAYSKMFLLGKKSQAVGSNKSVTVFDGFLEIVGKYKMSVGLVVCDLGSEFMGDFLKHLEKLDIPQVFVDAGDKMRTSPIERFNKTLRTYLEKYRSIHGKITGAVLDQLIDAYNNVPHAQLEYSPLDILKSKAIQSEVANVYIRSRQNFVLHTLSVGTHVRILLSPTLFQKVKPVWSDKIYVIERVLNHTNYYVNGVDKPFKQEQLQVVNPQILFL